MQVGGVGCQGQPSMSCLWEGVGCGLHDQAAVCVQRTIPQRSWPSIGVSIVSLLPVPLSVPVPNPNPSPALCVVRCAQGVREVSQEDVDKFKLALFDDAAAAATSRPGGPCKQLPIRTLPVPDDLFLVRLGWGWH